MKTLATVGDNCVDIYPQLGKAFSGGNAVNVAVYSTRYGMRPACVSWVGDDDYGDMLKQDLARHGVDITHMHTRPGVTAQTQVELRNNDRILGDYTEGVMAGFTVSEEDLRWLTGFDMIHSAIWGHADTAFPALHAAGKTLSFDFADKWESPLWRTLPEHLDYAFASAHEETPWLRDRLQTVVECGAGVAIATLGENGSLAWDGARFWRMPPEQVEVVDTMGAGDSYIAGFLCAVAAGLPLIDAMKQGTQCAARTLGYHGAW
ncbi:fructoselysine 6-kinase [Cronobacter malonaticus]|uniref:Fructoselysine 6-kinase n=1 Tax=Cronobacter malonaticus TaxID=413503 RepID=V5TU78_9ENTR|nr:fructoselysine 6-kinase [Cronobacter malonaticus]CCJ92615.1 Fructoselysine kinase [Cronobacter malonaticus 681]AHB68668.1 fructoselysine 6-kinase [Cronobacter malonaticus]ALX76954.1 fructoselysine 6-kinase [Cronobacter malonaticus LMG 23826]EGT4281976.1 fructoselysine 6-kinase [Cronobacter malonaticus]EGT4289448.1 fructoselysine 6-kinase [Cronobacter malonaticus]